MNFETDNHEGSAEGQDFIAKTPEERLEELGIEEVEGVEGVEEVEETATQSGERFLARAEEAPITWDELMVRQGETYRQSQREMLIEESFKFGAFAALASASYGGVLYGAYKASEFMTNLAMTSPQEAVLVAGGALTIFIGMTLGAKANGY